MSKQVKKNKNALINRWAILAQSSAVDRDNNLLSIFDIVETLTLGVAGNLPDNAVLPVKLELISLWERESDGSPLTCKIKFVFKDPDGKILNEGTGVLELASQHKRNRFRTRFNGVPVTKTGIYTYEILSLEPEKTNGLEFITSVPVEIKIEKVVNYKNL
jgi:hypothetical protein